MHELDISYVGAPLLFLLQYDGAAVAGVVSELGELALGRERHAAAREAHDRNADIHIGRRKALDRSKAALAQRMHASGESAITIASDLGVRVHDQCASP